MPVLVLLFLEGLDPVVGYAHCHAVVKADTAVLDRQSETGHTAHLLGDRYSVAVVIVDQLVGKREIGDRVGVLGAVVVVAVAAERLPQAVVIVEHRRDAVEAETVKVIFFHPVFAVGQQEMEHLVLAIVEAERVPGRMFAASVAIEIEIIATVETPETLDLVLDGVAVDYVHDHSYAFGVSGIDQSLELLGCAETARRGEETRHMIAERPVIRMLLNRHDLNCIVAVGSDSGKDLFAELTVGADTLAVLRHAYMALVDQKGLCVGNKVAAGPLISLGRFPHLSRKNSGIAVLHHTSGVCRDALTFSSVPTNHHLVEIAVPDRFVREIHYPHSVVAAPERIHRFFLPAGKVADQSDGRSVWRPFAECPCAVGIVVKSEIMVCVGKVNQVAAQFLEFAHGIFVTAVDRIGIWLEPRIILDDRQQFCRCFATRLTSVDLPWLYGRFRP